VSKEYIAKGVDIEKYTKEMNGAKKKLEEFDNLLGYSANKMTSVFDTIKKEKQQNIIVKIRKQITKLKREKHD
jgi:hypothetical protein